MLLGSGNDNSNPLRPSPSSAALADLRGRPGSRPLELPIPGIRSEGHDGMNDGGGERGGQERGAEAVIREKSVGEKF